MLAFYILVLLFGNNFVIGLDKEVSIIVHPNQKNCFYEHVLAGKLIDIEYQVIDGGHGDLDISFDLLSPESQLLVNEYKRSENIHRVYAEKEGDYQFCFDNSFSTFNSKTIFFELIIETEGDAASRESLDYEGLSPEEVYEITVQEILDSVIKVKSFLIKARHYQDMLKSFEARDRNIAEENFFKVNIWSMIQIFLMLSVGTLQVFMVKSLFSVDGKSKKMWSNISKSFCRFS